MSLARPRGFAAFVTLAAILLSVAIVWDTTPIVAAAVLMIGAAASIGWAGRRDPRLGGAGGAAAMTLLALVLAVFWIVLGAAIDGLRLGPPVSTARLAVAAVATGLLLGAAVRTLDERPIGADTLSRATALAAGLAWLALVWGALTVETRAGSACAGFPLCNGHVLPPLRLGADPVQIHWTHRLLAYVLVFLVVASAAAALRSLRTPIAAGAALLLAFAEAAVGAGLAVHPGAGPPLRWHLALALALWGVLVVWALRARRTAPPVLHHPARRAGRRDAGGRRQWQSP